MKCVETRDVLPMLRAMYSSRESMVPCLLGEPGIGKTALVHQLAEELGVECHEFQCAQMSPFEVTGITVPDHATGLMKVYDYELMHCLKPGDILFMDELLQAPQEVLKECLKLITERRLLSGFKIPDVFIVAASNVVGSPSQYDRAVLERFQFVQVKFDAGSWCEYIKRTRNVDASGLKRLLRSTSLKDEWNQFTPRSATKAIDMMLREMESGSADDAVKWIDSVWPDAGMVVRSVCETSTDDAHRPDIPGDTLSDYGNMLMEIAGNMGFMDCEEADAIQSDDELIEWLERRGWLDEIVKAVQD